MKDKKQALDLLGQIIEKSEYDDSQHKKEMIEQHQGSKAIGESWMTFYLKRLRELMIDE
jgi:hypothetical protein